MQTTGTSILASGLSGFPREDSPFSLSFFPLSLYDGAKRLGFFAKSNELQLLQ